MGHWRSPCSGFFLDVLCFEAAITHWDTHEQYAILPLVRTAAIRQSPHVNPPSARPAPLPSTENSPAPTPVPKVLIAHSDPALLRLARESLEAFLECDVRTTSSALSAFDRILQEPYRLLLLDLHLPQIGGELLYDLISRAYPRVHSGSLTSPPVLWLGTPRDLPRQDELTREARTKALLITPLNIHRLLTTAGSVLPSKNHPAAR